ncbi:YqaA family protein [Devosia geojensis]|uniref:YqaA family protein n=1 Tax=Devosia geojensis TaxID=443610 RepID=UPI000697F53B|nr:YqaA family protein [Devosia geojensis]
MTRPAPMPMTDIAKPKLSFYDRLKLATKHRLAEPILAALCFLEAMILPIFPEIMLAPMIIADRMRAWRLAAICTISSVAGGLAGYAIGYFLFDTVGRAIIELYGAGEGFASLTRSFNDNGPLMILIGALSPIPYKVVTITSGVAGLDLWTFIIYGFIGRGLRYFVPCGLFYFFGPAANAFIEKHKAVAGWAMIVAVVAGFALAPLLFPKPSVDLETLVIEASDHITGDLTPES